MTGVGLSIFFGFTFMVSVAAIIRAVSFGSSHFRRLTDELQRAERNGAGDTDDRR